MKQLVVHSALVLCLAIGVSACGAGEDVDELTGTDESALDLGLSPAALTDMNAVDPIAAADAMVAKSDGDGCKTKVKDAQNPNVVHVYLDNCAGRFGRHTKSGEITVTFSANPDGTLHADHQSVWLEIDGQPATRHATADITFDGDDRHVVWHSEKSVTKEDVGDVTRVSDHVVDIDGETHCSVVNGTATKTKGDKVIHAVLNNLTSCAAPEGGHYCPTGTIVATVEGRDIAKTKTFDGTETAIIDVSHPKGDKTKEILLDCIPTSN